MKSIVILSIVLLLLTVPTFGELTTADIEKIYSIVKAEGTDVKQQVAASETRMKEYVAASETRMKEYVAASETRMKDHISERIQTVNVTIAEMNKRLDQIFTLVITLVAFIAVVIGVPQIIVALQRKNQHAQDEKIEGLQNQIEVLQKAMERFTQEPIVKR